MLKQCPLWTLNTTNEVAEKKSQTKRKKKEKEKKNAVILGNETFIWHFFFYACKTIR